MDVSMYVTPFCPYPPPPVMNVLPGPVMGRPVPGSRTPSAFCDVWRMLTGGVQLVLSAAPMAAPASLSSAYGSMATVPMALSHTLATIASSQAAPVQNWLAVHVVPHLPQL